MVVAQLTSEGANPAGGGLVAYLGTFILTTLFYGITLHIAARYVLGEVRLKHAFTVAPALGLVSLLLQQWGPRVVFPMTIAIAYTGIVIVYDLRYRIALLVSVVYYTVAVIAGVTIYNLIILLGTAPG